MYSFCQRVLCVFKHCLITRVSSIVVFAFLWLLTLAYHSVAWPTNCIYKVLLNLAWNEQHAAGMDIWLYLGAAQHDLVQRGCMTMQLCGASLLPPYTYSERRGLLLGFVFKYCCSFNCKFSYFNLYIRVSIPAFKIQRMCH